MIYSSDRSFSVFSYDIRHGLLLLRSGKTDVHSSRVDILFKDVVAMELRMLMNKILIKNEDPIFLDNVMSKSSAIIEPGHKVYSLNCDDWTGFVIGGVLNINEDDKSFFESSMLI